MPRMRRCRYPGCHKLATVPNHYCSMHIDHESEYRARRKQYQEHTHHYFKKYNRDVRNRNEVKREQYSFYRSKQWQGLRKQVLDHDHYICRYCGAINSKTVDHIIPIEYAPDKMADIDNLATICRACHTSKTKWEQGYYGTGSRDSIKDVTPIQDISTIKQLIDSLNLAQNGL